jgi:crotonobetainyl-CoA:carnitine CoA-transferase CaiB-like acyl-CoA transferase
MNKLILETGSGIAAAFAGSLLAAAGADVLRVSIPCERRPEDPAVAAYEAALDCWLNREKRRVNITPDAAGLGELLRHAAAADLVIEDLGPAARSALGLRPVPDELTTTWIAITPFGLDRFDEPATNLTISALSGAMWAIGRPEREPLALPHQYPAVTAGAVAALAAAGSIAGEGEPRIVDISAVEAVAGPAATNGSLFVWEREGHRAARSGGAYPYTMLPCRDGFVCVAGRSNADWKRILAAFGTPSWSGDPRFQDVREIADRWADEADVFLRETLAPWTRAELTSLAAEQGLAIAPVSGIDDLVADGGLRTRNVIVDVPGESSTFTVPRLPWLDSHADEPPAPRPNGREATLAVAADGWMPLAGKRVLDFGWVVSGPYAGLVLAGLGADVIKIESRSRADNMRLRGAIKDRAIDWSIANNAPTFHAVNRGKRSFGVNLKTERGLELVKELVRASDAIIENFTVGTLERLGLDDDTLRKLNPALARISLTPSGRVGALAGMRGYAGTTGALGGLEGSIGYPDEEGPTGMLTFGIADYTAGLLGAFSVAASLAQPNGYRSIDASQVDSTVISLGAAFAARAAGYAPRLGNDEPGIWMQGAFRSADGGWIALSVPAPADWGRVATGLELPADATSTEARRSISEWVAERGRDESVTRLQELRLPAAPVLSMKERADQPLFRERSFDLHLTMGNGTTITAGALPWIVGGKRDPSAPRAPDVGEDTVDICRTVLAMAEEEVAELVDEGVLEVTEGREP